MRPLTFWGSIFYFLKICFKFINDPLILLLIGLGTSHFGFFVHSNILIFSPPLVIISSSKIWCQIAFCISYFFLIA
jgi:hypothetical protein